MKEVIKIDNPSDYMDVVSEVKIALNKIRSLVVVYGNKYVDAASLEERITALRAAPEIQQYLFACLIDEVTEAIKQIETIDA